MLATIQLINSNMPIPWSMDVIFGTEEELSGVKNVKADQLWLNAESLLKCSRHTQEFGSDVLQSLCLYQAHSSSQAAGSEPSYHGS